MNTLLSNTRASDNVKETIAALLVHTRSRVISAADVWNIQRQKRVIVQRRFAL